MNLNKNRRAERSTTAHENEAVGIFVKIADGGSISKAAQELYISQPSLTKAISSLEEEFHVQLLLRKPRGVELTIEGKSFLHYAQARRHGGQQRSESNFSGSGGAGPLAPVYRLAAARLCPSAHPEDLSAKSGPQSHYNLVETDRNDVTRMVLDGKADIGLFVRCGADAKSYLWNTESKREPPFAR